MLLSTPYGVIRRGTQRRFPLGACTNVASYNWPHSAREPSAILYRILPTQLDAETRCTAAYQVGGPQHPPLLPSLQGNPRHHSGLHPTALCGPQQRHVPPPQIVMALGKVRGARTLHTPPHSCTAHRARVPCLRVVPLSCRASAKR